MAAVTNQSTEEQVHAQEETERAAERVLREAASIPTSHNASTSGAAAALASGGDARPSAGSRLAALDDAPSSSASGYVPASRGGGVGGDRRSGAPAAAGALGRTSSPGLGLGLQQAAIAAAAASLDGAASGSPDADGRVPRGRTSASGVSASSGLAHSDSVLHDREYKRKLYPAGRILHFFPASVLQGPGAGAAAAGPLAQQQQEAAVGAGMAGATNPAEAEAARAASSSMQQAVLFATDTEAYGRIKLCRTMVADHLVPAYLISIDSVLQQLLQEQQQEEADDGSSRGGPDTDAMQQH